MADAPQDESNEEFMKRRAAARARINALDKSISHNQSERQEFFNAVYAQANGDAAYVPWADLEAKEKLNQWLKDNNGFNLSKRLKAIDVACGLGDNAEAMAGAGYETTAFDLAVDAIDWAKARFPQSKIDYRQADLFQLPEEWIGQFDLVHECYTLQALPPETLGKTASAIASLVKPGGRLLVFTRTRKNGGTVEGPPWPLEEDKLEMFYELGFELKSDERFQNRKNDRVVPHAFMQWNKLV